MSLTATLLIINTFLTFAIFIKVDQMVKRIENIEDFIKVTHKVNNKVYELLGLTRK